jgi:methyl-accepting chemotaxis protein
MSFFQKTSLKMKLLTLTLSLSIFAVAAGGAGIYFLKSIEESYDHIIERTIPKQSNVKEMVSLYRRLRVYVTLLAIPSLSKQDSDRSLKTISETLEKYESADKSYNSYPFVPGQKELYDSMNSDWLKYREITLKVTSLFKSGKAADKELMTKLIVDESDSLAQVFSKDNQALLTFHENSVKLRKAQAQETAARGNLLSIIIAALSFVFAFIIGIIFSNYVTKSLQVIATNLSTSGDQVSSAATQIASASEELSQATTEQGASLQETSSSIEEISSMINANTENAKQSSLVSEKSLSTAERGKVVVDHMIKAIGDINISNTGIVNQIVQSHII